jgi:hypothetical protein
VRIAVAAAVCVVAAATLVSGCGGAGAITRTVTRTVPSLPATTGTTPTVSTLPAGTTQTRPADTTATVSTLPAQTRTTPTRPTTTVATTTVATTTVATTTITSTTIATITGPVTTMIETLTEAAPPPATTKPTSTTSTTATTSSGVNTAVVVATGVVAAQEEQPKETPWGWIAFGILAAGVIGFLIVWLVRRNRGDGSPPEPPAASVSP